MHVRGSRGYIGQRPDCESGLRHEHRGMMLVGADARNPLSRDFRNVRYPTVWFGPLSTLSGLLRLRHVSRVGSRQSRLGLGDHGLKAGIAAQACEIRIGLL